MRILSPELVRDSAKHCAQFVCLSILTSGAAAFANTRAKTKGHEGRQRCLHWGLRLEEATQCLQRGEAKNNLRSYPQLRQNMSPLEKCLQTCTPAAVPGCMSNLPMAHPKRVSRDLDAGEEPNGRHSQPARNTAAPSTGMRSSQPHSRRHLQGRPQKRSGGP